MSRPTPSWWIVVVALLLVALFAVSLLWTLFRLLTADGGMVINRLESEASRLASTMFFEKMTTLAQLTTALIGATWALVTLADTNVKVKNWRTVMCFTLANLSLALSLLVYAYGYDLIVARVFHHATFDIDAPLVIAVSSGQQRLFLTGCFYLALTVLLGRKSP